MLVKDKLYVGGRWVAPYGKQSIDVHNAGTGEVMGRVPASGVVSALPCSMHSTGLPATQKRHLPHM